MPVLDRALLVVMKNSRVIYYAGAGIQITILPVGKRLQTDERITIKTKITRNKQNDLFNGREH